MLAEIIHEAGAAGGASKSQGNMMYSMAGKFPAGALKHRPALLAYVMADKISKVPQIEGAFKYLKTVGDRDLDPGKLEEAAGVGVVVTEADVAAAVAAALEESAARLAEERYFFNTGTSAASRTDLAHSLMVSASSLFIFFFFSSWFLASLVSS